MDYLTYVYNPVYFHPIHLHYNPRITKEQIPTLVGCYLVLLIITIAYMVYAKKKDVRAYRGSTYWSKLENINAFLWSISMITLCITGLLIFFGLGSLIGNLIKPWII